MGNLYRMTDYRDPAYGTSGGKGSLPSPGAASSPSATGVVSFGKQELNQILSLYSRRVIRGEWKDYSIDFSSSMAVFSVYRQGKGQPVFSIAKAARKHPKGRYLLFSGQRKIARGHQLKDILAALERKPILIFSKG